MRTGLLALNGRWGRVFRNTALYRWSLSRDAPDKVLLSPPEHWPGDSRRGAQLVRGEFASGGDAVPLHDPVWTRDDVNGAWLEDLHGFDWLSDLQAAGGDRARHTARDLLLDWIGANPPCATLGWRVDLVGRRLANWLVRYEFVAPALDDDARRRLLRSIGTQVQHLVRAPDRAATGLGRLDVAKALIYAGLALPDGEVWARKGMAQLGGEIDAQILADGGHVSRDPGTLLAALRRLIDIRTALVATGFDVPDFLPDAIRRTVPMLRFFRHGDGRLALFNGANEESETLIDAVLGRSNVRGRPLTATAESGYQRLAAGRTLIVTDVGAPPPAGYDQRAHAGTLSFEMSAGRARIVVNCGAYPGGDGSWRQVARTTAAHSTAVIRSTNSSGVDQEGGLSRRPTEIACRREEADGASLVDASHDGYREAFGLVHRRRLYLSASGDDVRGEDTLSGEGWHDVTVRFHLHPSVRASLVQDGSAVLLRPASGAGWRFTARDGTPELQPSVYMGERGRIQRSQQITVAGSTEGGAMVLKWTLKRLPAAS